METTACLYLLELCIVTTVVTQLQTKKGLPLSSNATTGWSTLVYVPEFDGYICEILHIQFLFEARGVEDLMSDMTAQTGKQNVFGIF